MIKVGDRVQVVSNLIYGSLADNRIGFIGNVVAVDYEESFGLMTVELENPAIAGGLERLNFFFEELKLVE